MGKKDSFEHESLQDAQSVAAYLQQVIEGFRSGTLELSDEDAALRLEPRGLVTLQVRVNQKRGRTRLDLRLSWREEPAPGGDGGLRITGGAAAPPTG